MLRLRGMGVENNLSEEMQTVSYGVTFMSALVRVVLQLHQGPMETSHSRAQLEACEAEKRNSDFSASCHLLCYGPGD